MTVVQYEQPQPLPPSRPGDEDQPGPTGAIARLRMAAEYAGLIGDSEFVPDTLRNRPAAIAAAIVAGAELGLDPIVALRTIVIIKGRPTLTAEVQRGLVTSRGHEMWFEESTTTRAIAAGRRRGSERVGRITWTLDDAKRAGLAGQNNWRSYPAEMLRARASAALARAMFADVTLGLPASEELEGDDNGAPAIAATPPPDDAPAAAPAGRTRRRRPAAAPPPRPELPDEEQGGGEPEPARPPVTPTPPPDRQPEPPLERDPSTEPPATDAQKRQIFALMRDVALADREARLAYTSRVIGRTLATSNELTIGDAGLVIDDLQEVVKLPAGDERDRRLLGQRELELLLEADEVAQAGQDAEPAAPEDGDREPVPYNEFPEGF